MLDEHAEGGAPVTHVILPDHVVPDRLEHAHQAVTEDRGAQMPDVHLLCDVRRRVVDHHPLRHVGRGDAEPLVRRDRAGGAREECVGQGHIDEAGAGDLDLPGDRFER
jgi:hypothetical protein